MIPLASRIEDFCREAAKTEGIVIPDLSAMAAMDRYEQTLKLVHRESVKIAALRPATRDRQRHGIPAQQLSTIFEKYKQSGNKSFRGGTGLGLYIVKGLIEAHGGDVAVGRAPEGGAQFRFTLPVGAPAFMA
jgi:signal transduction histidine kinase